MEKKDFDTQVIRYFKVTPSYIKEARKEFKRLKKVFIKFIAYHGEFDEVLSKNEIKHAKKGQLPEYLDIHHIVPLSGGGSNDFMNLAVITKSTHKFINKKFFQPQLSEHQREPYGSVFEVEIPLFNTRVDSGRIIQYKDELVRNIKNCKKYEK